MERYPVNVNRVCSESTSIDSHTNIFKPRDLDLCLLDPKSTSAQGFPTANMCTKFGCHLWLITWKDTVIHCYIHIPLGTGNVVLWWTATSSSIPLYSLETERNRQLALAQRLYARRADWSVAVWTLLHDQGRWSEHSTQRIFNRVINDAVFAFACKQSAVVKHFHHLVLICCT